MELKHGTIMVHVRDQWAAVWKDDEQGTRWTYPYLGKRYSLGKVGPRYPVPAIPSRVEYVFIGGLMDGIFIRVDDYIVAGAYADGMSIEGYPSIPYEYDYPDFD